MGLSFVESLGLATKAVLARKLADALPFANYAGTAPLNGNPYVGGWGGLRGGIPGAQADYVAMAGEPLDNRVVASCVNAVAQAAPFAPRVLEEKRGTEWKIVPDDEVTELLRAPLRATKYGDVQVNNGYGGWHLWGWLCAFEMTRGQAFWIVDLDNAGRPAQLRVARPEDFRIYPARDQFIGGYDVLVDGMTHELKGADARKVLHFRHALHHYNPRVGWTPLSAGFRQIVGENATATYHSALMRNVRAIGLLFSGKDTESARNVTPEQFESLIAQIDNKIGGEGAGGSATINLPIDVHKIGLTPNEMALDKLLNYYEASVCALLGVDPMVVGLGSGTSQKTYANMGEALADFWKRRIKPMNARQNSELDAQLLPLFGLDSAKYRLNNDYSQVEALQEAADQRHLRVREDFKAGVIDRFTAKAQMDYTVDDSDKGVYYQPPKDAAPSEGAPPPAVAGATKAYDPNEPRDGNGQWTSGNGGYHDVDAAADMREMALQAAEKRPSLLSENELYAFKNPPSPHVMKAARAVLNTVFEAYGVEPPKSISFRSVKGRTDSIHSVESDPTSTARTWNIAENGNSIEKLNELAQKNRAIGHLVAADARGILAHEAAHYLYEAMPAETRAQVPELFEKWKAAGADGLGRYAATNEEEFFAELVVLQMQHEWANLGKANLRLLDPLMARNIVSLPQLADAAKMLDANGMSHSNADGRFDGGEGEKLFQRAKEASLNDLCERADSNRPEALYAIDMDTGAVLHFGQATADDPNSVELNEGKIAGVARVCVLHSHDTHSPPSADDWDAFMHPSIVESIAVTSRVIYRLTKPNGFSLPDVFGTAKPSLVFYLKLKRCLQKLGFTDLRVSSIPVEKYVAAVETVNAEMSKDYGVNFQREKRT